MANSSPVNPVVFFDVSIGGQVRPRPPLRRRDTARGQPGRSHPPRDSGFKNPGSETGPDPTDLRGRGTGAGGEVLPILAPRRGRDWAARKERLWRRRWKRPSGMRERGVGPFSSLLAEAFMVLDRAF